MSSRFLMNYVLNDAGEAVPEPDIEKWSAWATQAYGPSDDREHMPRRVAISKIGDWEISTVFLAFDHGWSADGPPILWELMTFGPPPWDEYQERFSSRADALAGHFRVFEMILAGMQPDNDRV